jgi:hypothetical protein
MADSECKLCCCRACILTRSMERAFWFYRVRNHALTTPLIFIAASILITGMPDLERAICTSISWGVLIVSLIDDRRNFRLLKKVIEAVMPAEPENKDNREPKS